MVSLWDDLRYSARALRKSPGFAATAILTLALGIGAATAIFSVVNSVLLRPYPFRDPGQLVIWHETIQEVSDRYPLVPDNYRHYQYLKAHSKTISDAAIFQNASLAITQGNDHPQIVSSLSVSPNFLSVLGAAPVLGRTFLAEENQKGSDTGVILTWSAWQRFFNLDSNVIGRSLTVNGGQKTVVGVLPKSFTFPKLNEMGDARPGELAPYEIFQPLVPQEEELTSDDGDFGFLVVARLKPGASLKESNTELDGLEKSYSLSKHLSIQLGAAVEPFSQEATGSVSKELWLLFAAVLGVLLIACFNLASLQLARAIIRERDNAVRAALGASQGRLVQARLMEGLLLSALGGLAGVLLALIGVRFFIAIAPANLPRLNEVHTSWPVLAFAGALSLVTVFAFGSFSALHSLRTDPQRVLISGSGRLSNTPRAMAVRRFLVSFEVACTVVLLFCTVLIARSFAKIIGQNRAFTSAHLTVAQVELPGPRYNQGDASIPVRATFIDQALDRLRENGTAQFAAITSTMPLTGEAKIFSIYRPDHPLPEAELPQANLRKISPDYFAAMQIPLTAGADFGEAVRSHVQGAIISQNAARAAWPGENALGRKFRINGAIYTVIGIAADARINDLRRKTLVVYLPYWHDPPAEVFFLIRSRQSAEALSATIRQALWRTDREVAIPVIKSLDRQVDESVAAERFQTRLLSSFGIAALMLATLGVYGVLAYSVSLRTQEFGIRIALGSSRNHVMGLVLREASYSVLSGLLIGLLAASVAASVIRSMLYETSTTDPSAFALSAALLLLAALLAAALPAYRALQVEPIKVLRQE